MFLTTLQDAIDYFRNTEKFHIEVAQLSRLIFMNCKQFRMMKGLHEMKKIHQALLRYLNLDIASTIETFKGFIDDSESRTVTLPYQQNLDFILVKLQGLSKLLIRAIVCSKNCARFFLGLIKAGSFYAKGVVFLSTIASVWSRSREFSKSVVEHYNKLHQFRQLLTVKPGLDCYQLPDKLEIWLGDDWTNMIVNRTYDTKLLLTESDIKDFLENENHLQRFEQESNKEFVFPQLAVAAEINDSLELEDITPIPRVKADHKPKSQDEHSLSSLTSKDSIQRFIKYETNFRKVDKLKSLTINKMKKKVWKDFKDDIRTKFLLMQEGAFIDYVKDYLEEYTLV